MSEAKPPAPRGFAAAHRPAPGRPLAAAARLLAVAAGIGLSLISSDPAARAQYSIASFEEESGSNRIDLTGVFHPPPSSGYQPVRVETTNATNTRRSWRLEFASEAAYASAGRTRGAFDVPAEPGSSQSILMVPLQVSNSSGSWNSGHRLKLSATSSRGGSYSTESHTERIVNFPAIAISEALAIKSLNLLNTELGGTVSGHRHYGNALFGSRFLPAQLPDDWLGFSGFDHLMMTADEWLSVTPGVRSAILQASRFGLDLHLYRTTESIGFSSLGLSPPNQNDTEFQYGMGRIQLATWSGDTMDPRSTIAKFTPTTSQSLLRRITGDYSGSAWGLQNALGERNFAAWQVVVFLLVFGLLIGPVNLFLLAPAGRRHKLFITTPLISLVSSLLLVLLILIQDGTGGQGRRFIAIHLPPGEAAAYVTQEQVSRTGVLLRSGFDLPRPGYIVPVVLSGSSWTKYSGNTRDSQVMNTRIDRTRVSGNWFQSRTIQAQFLRSLVPTRGRIDLIPPQAADGPPAIVSSLEMELTGFVLRDAGGAVWRADGPVAQGVPVTLVRDPEAWKHHLNRFRGQCSRHLAADIDETVSQNPAFLATAAGAQGFAIDTLSSIKWRDDAIVIFGTLPATP